MQNTKNNGDYPLNAGKPFYQQFFDEELYRIKSASVESSKAGPEDEISNDTIIIPSGDSTADTLVLFHEPGVDCPSGSKKELLDNILKAIGLSLEQVSWINVSQHPPATWRDFTLASNANKFIVFGLPPHQSPGNAAPGQIYSFNGRRSIATISLGALEKNAATKKQFWGLLKELYGQ